MNDVRDKLNSILHGFISDYNDLIPRLGATGIIILWP